MQSASSNQAMTVIFDQTSNFAHVPNLLGYHPGRYALHGWLTARLAPLAIRKRLRPGWQVRIDGNGGALVDNKDRELLTFEIVKGHNL
jgi:hypothetical protein